MLVKELNLTNFKREFAEYFTDEGAEMLFNYLTEIFADEEKLIVIDEAAIKGQFDFILKYDYLDLYEDDYKEEELNIVDVGITGVLVEW